MKRLLSTSIGITILLIVCTIDDFLSLHDIKADYVSKSALQYLNIDTLDILPSWTDTALEWTSVRLSFILRSVLIISNLGVLVLLRRTIHRANSNRDNGG